MSPALIRLSKSFIIAEKDSHAIFKKIWEKAFHTTKIYYSDNGGGWNKDPRDARNDSELSSKIRTNSTQNVMEFHGIMPGMPNPSQLVTIQFDDMKDFNVTVLNFDREEKASFKVNLELISEPLTLIDHAGENLLLTKGNALKAVQDGAAIENTFFIKVELGIMLRNYSTKPE